MTKSIFKAFLIFIFIVGILALLNNKEIPGSRPNENDPELENFYNTPDCPNMLIKEGNKLLLLNTNKQREPGVNPKIFNNLDEYIKHLEVERVSGKKCPILFLQKEINTQGEEEYRIRPGPFDMEGGMQLSNGLYRSLERDGGNIVPLDANRDGEYNKNQFPGFDGHNLHMGQYTTIDKVHDSTINGLYSDNPMDSNWGGYFHTKAAVEAGKYKDREVVKPRLFTPNDTYNPDVPTQFKPPQDILS
tara:strand:- start:290 stop:1027 length:738 start_codon:yes stop_codon:yes gene_type:complete